MLALPGADHAVEFFELIQLHCSVCAHKELADHGLQRLLIRERKVPIDVDLAEQLTGPRVDGANRALLVRLLLLLAAELPRVEVEDLLVERLCAVCLLYTSPSPRD